jgi:hypothetical protein
VLRLAEHRAYLLMKFIDLPKDVLRFLICNFLLNDVSRVLRVCKSINNLFQDQNRDLLYLRVCQNVSREINKAKNVCVCQICGMVMRKPKCKTRFTKAQVNHIYVFHSHEKLNLFNNLYKRCQVCLRNIPKDKVGSCCHRCAIEFFVPYACYVCDYIGYEKVNSDLLLSERRFYSYLCKDVVFVDKMNVPRWRHWRYIERCSRHFIDCNGCNQNMSHVRFTLNKHFLINCWLDTCEDRKIYKPTLQ